MNGFKIISKNKIGELPKTSGVYCFFTKNLKFKIKNLKLECIYIGKAINIKNRVKNHFNQPSYRDNLFMHKVEKIGFLETGSEIEALILEANLIKKYQPRFNVVWKDDKNYFYVAITKDEKPVIYITHRPNQLATGNWQLATSNKNKNPKLEVRSQKLEATYIGPFVEGNALKKTLRFLRRAFPYYATTKHPKTNCTYCHLGLCPGPLLFENPPSLEASAGLRDYKKNIKKLILILKGKKNSVLSSLKKEMNAFSKENKFEEAGKTRDKIFALQQIMAHTKVLEQTKMDFTWDKTEKILQGLLNLQKISRIECYDVSNIQGKFATGSMVVFIDGKPDKNLYRKFKIKIKNTPNDIAMLKETLQRRFTHPEWKYPEVILIDGGKAQLNVAIKSKIQSSKSKNIRVLSLAKRNKELFVEEKEKSILLKTLPQEIYNLILQLDDEAHRFAITYHKNLRKKNLLQ